MTLTWQELLKGLFFSGNSGMSITSMLFLGFFVAVAILNYVLPRVARPYLLLAASYFYYCYDPVNRALVPVLLSATLMTWGCGWAIYKCRKKPARVAFLLLSILTCVSFLLYYKYWNMLSDVTGGLVARHDLITPLGLSYFVFAALSYSIDVYKHRSRVEKNLLHYAFFVSFFPTLVTGPIERYPHLRPQIKESRRFSYDRCAGGAFRMAWGYVKKMVIADNLAMYVSFVYEDAGSQSGPQLLAATALFCIQLYMDFSGCCDIALGAARILGYDLIENFRRPFESTSFSQFWSRWHVSMTSWFQDYVYFSLGGSRCATWRALLNTIIVFLVSGLWHGADWRYLAWGLSCGIVSVLAKLTKKPRQLLADKNPIYRIGWLKHLLQACGVDILFCLTVIFFSSAYYNADPFVIYGGLLSGWGSGALAEVGTMIAACGIQGHFAKVLAGSIVFIFVVEHFSDNIAKWIRQRFILFRWVLYYAAAALILFYAAFGQSVFIYQTY